MRVLFVCRANVGRSQAAMEFYNQLRPGQAASAGTIVSIPGERVKVRYSQAAFLKAMREFDIDISNNVRVPVSEQMLHHYDKIIVMAERSTLPKYLATRKGSKVEYWKIEDAKGRSLEASRKIRDEIKKRVEDFIDRGV